MIAGHTTAEVRYALRLHRGHIESTARELGIGASTLRAACSPGKPLREIWLRERACTHCGVSLEEQDPIPGVQQLCPTCWEMRKTIDRVQAQRDQCAERVVQADVALVQLETAWRQAHTPRSLDIPPPTWGRAVGDRVVVHREQTGRVTPGWKRGHRRAQGVQP